MKVKDMIEEYAPCDDGVKLLKKLMAPKANKQRFLEMEINYDKHLGKVEALEEPQKYAVGWLLRRLPYQPLETHLCKLGYRLNGWYSTFTWDWFVNSNIDSLGITNKAVEIWKKEQEKIK